jgi:micrococcal nuclease
MSVTSASLETLKELKWFHPITDYTSKINVRVIDAYDGDTCTMVFNLFGDTRQPLVKFRARLMGIDTPEIKSKEASLKQKAIDARNFVRDKVVNVAGVTCVFCEDMDKYGRLLVRLFTPNGEDVAELLIKQGYAKRYDGGTKDAW